MCSFSWRSARNAQGRAHRPVRTPHASSWRCTIAEDELFLLEVRAWSRELDGGLQTDSLPEGLEKLFARLVSASEDVRGPAEEERRGSPDIPGVVTRLARSGRDIFLFTGELTLSALRCLAGARVRWKDCLIQMRLSGSSALPVVSLISFLVGTIMAFQAAVQLRQFGAGLYVVDLVDLAIVREMGPVMAGIVVAGRTGSAFAAHLGTMVVGEEIDALRTFAISPFDFLVLPRVLALFLMLPVLTLYDALLRGKPHE